MKTAISLPDDTFIEVTKRAHDLGISRSEFFAVAARRYLDELDRHSITTRIDQVLAQASPDDSGEVAAAVGRRRLVGEAGW